MFIDIHDALMGWSDALGGLLLLFLVCCCCWFLSDDGDVGCALIFCCLDAEPIECLGDLSWISVVTAVFEVDKRPVLLLLLPVLRPCVCSLSSLDGI
jgi:hypothetical protein